MLGLGRGQVTIVVVINLLVFQRLLHAIDVNHQQNPRPRSAAPAALFAGLRRFRLTFDLDTPQVWPSRTNSAQKPLPLAFAQLMDS